MSIGSVSSNNYPPLKIQRPHTVEVGEFTRELYKEYTNNETLSSTYSTKWGFKVNENGFFGADFNKATGIPEKVKIHQTMLAQAQEYAQVTKSSLDPVAMVTQAWNVFKTVAGNTLDPEGTGFMTQQQINDMPLGFVSKGGIFDGVVSIQKNIDEFQDASLLDQDMRDATNEKLSTGTQVFVGGILSEPSTFRETYEFFTNAHYAENLPSDKISTGELFSSFFFERTEVEKMNPKMIESTKNFYTFVESGQTLKSFMDKNIDTSYMDELKKRLSTKLDGTFDPKRVDAFFEQLNSELEKLISQYNSNSYSFLDTTKKASHQEKPTTYTSSSLPNGSLISVAT